MTGCSVPAAVPVPIAFCALTGLTLESSARNTSGAAMPNSAGAPVLVRIALDAAPSAARIWSSVAVAQVIVCSTSPAVASIAFTNAASVTTA